MSVLTNRRDITAARNAQAQVEPEPQSHMPDALLRDLLAEIRLNTALTSQQLQEERADISELCVTDREPAQAAMDNFPVAGAKRLIVRRPGNGGTFAIPVTTPTLLCAANESRLGGLVTVSGATGVTLILTTDLLEPGGSTPLSAGCAQIWVPVGGAWNFKLSDLVWCGNVLAYATAATTVLLAEV